MPKKSLLVATVVLIALLLWLLRPLARRSPGETYNASDQRADTQAARVQPRAQTTPAAGSSRAPSAVSREMQRAAATEWFAQRFSHSMTLYGIVLDEHDRFVRDAGIDLEWINAQGEPFHSTNRTDSAGRFSVTGLRGKALNIDVQKAGYYFSRNENRIRFEYADSSDSNFYTADPVHPVIFHLHKKGPPEPLLAERFLLPVRHNGEVVNFDPQRCKITPQGPLAFRFRRGPPFERSPLTISVLDGGIQLASGEFPFEAPETDYAPTLTFGESDLSHASDELQCFFYYGQPRLYGRLKFSKYDLSREGLYITCLLNPKGSRTLEFDPQAYVPTVQEYYLRSNTPSINSLP